MARKKAEVTEVTEEIQGVVAAEPVEEVVEEVKPKKSRKKKVETPVEESGVEQTPELPVVEEVKEEPVLDAKKVEEYFEKLDSESADAPIVFDDAKVIETPVVEEKPKKVKKAKKVEAVAVKTEPAVAEVPYNAVVKAAVQLNVMKEPKVLCTKVGALRPGARIKILEVSGNFGKIGTGRWVNINYIEKI